MDASIPSAFDGISTTMAETQPEEEIEKAEETAVIDVKALVNAMEGRFETLPERKPYTISRVPAYIRQKNKKMYEPMVIAIGPYHHRKEHLQTAEEHKCRYLWSLLSRPTTRASLGVLFEKMKALEKEARSHYSESIDFESDEFVEMMLLDGCFIIELFLNYHNLDMTCNNMGWGFQLVRTDLLLLENQIPFLIIEELFGLVAGDAFSSPPTVIELVRPICQINCCLEKVQPALPPPAKIHHLLHLYYQWVVPAMKSTSDHHSPPHDSSERSEIYRDEAIPSATELWEAGVRFRKKSSPRHMLDITFRNGIVEIPFNQIDDYIQPTLTNLVAFEQSVLDSPKVITGFSVLMDSLINTEKDVAILKRCGIIENLLGSDEEVALFFNQLCEYVEYLDNHYFSELFRQVNCYCDSKWHRYRARLVHDYFSNPWAFLSLLAALVLLALTFVQSFFATYAYFHPP